MLPDSLNGRVHSGPNCWTDRSTGDVYVTHYPADLSTAYLSKITPVGVTTTTDLGGLSGNPLDLPVDSASDEHLALVVAQDADGYIYVGGNMHNDPMRLIRFDTVRTISGAFTDMTATLEVNSGDDYTYPVFASMSDGTLLFMARRRFADASNNIGYNSLWKKEPAGAWTHVGDVSRDMPHDTVAGGPEDAGDYLAYVVGFDVDENDVIHVTTTWADWGSTFSRDDLGYMRSEDGGATWTDIDGVTVTTPLEYANRNAQTISAQPGGGYNQHGATALDSSGYPGFPVGDLFSNVYIVRWTGAAWTSTLITDLTFVGRTRAVTVGGQLWVFGDVGSRIKALNIETGDIVSLGPDVGRGHEPPYDPEAIKDGILRTAFVLPDGTPTYRSFGGSAGGSNT